MIDFDLNQQLSFDSLNLNVLDVILYRGCTFTAVDFHWPCWKAVDGNRVDPYLAEISMADRGESEKT